MTQTSPLAAFQDGHRILDELLRDHQEALMSLDLAQAARHLASYRAELEVHMVVEEELVIPRFEQLGIEIKGGGAHFYWLEHKKLDGLLTGVEQGLAELTERGVSRGRDVITLLQREFTFEHLMEHHETRENYALYPALAEHLSADEQRDLWKRMQAREGQARADHSAAPS